MAGSTTFYKIAYFNYQDRLDSAINVQKEVHRMSFIDSQLYGMFNVFGNGVISGWSVTDNGFTEEKGISVGISIGQGIMRYTTCQSYEPFVLGPLPSNSTLYIYATSTNISSQSREVAFTYSASLVSNTRSALLAKVVTSANGITSIDNTVKTYIGFAQYLLSEIDSHKHRGTPSKIDLETETKNELPGARLEGFAASKVITGVFDVERLPLINHADLVGKGVLSHASLDTFYQNLQTNSNMQLLGEVTSINFMRSVLAQKLVDSDIDKQMVNQIDFLPSVDITQADEDASTAYIEESEGYIVGLADDTSGVTYFYTDNFFLPANPTKILLTSHESIPDGGGIVYGVNTGNSVDWSDYSTITRHQVSSITATSANLRLGIKFTSPTSSGSGTGNLFEDYIDFSFQNSGSTAAFHFRVRFYNDSARTDLYATAYSGNDQEGWIVTDSSASPTTQSIPSTGYSVTAGASIDVTYYPTLADFEPGKIYYLRIDAYDGSSFGSLVSTYRFVTHGDSNIPGPYGGYSYIRNFAFIFEMEGGQMVKLNL